MTLPSRVCSAIQHAGQAIFNAQKELASAASEQTRKINEAMQSGSVTGEVGTHFDAVKTSVTLAEEMTRINERLAAVFAAANGTAAAAPVAASTKPATPRVTKRSARASKKAKSAHAKLRGNNAKVWTMLQQQLNSKEFVGVTQAHIAQGAGIPLGSVAYSISRLMSLALIEEGSTRGTYRLR